MRWPSCFFLLVIITTAGFAQNDCTTTAVPPVLSESSRQALEKKLEEAKNEFLKDSTDPDAIIWLGRRTAYLGNYSEAISIFSRGIGLYPGDARFYRHRGHRYLTLRCFSKAATDFEKAAQLTKNKPDEVEPDGMPNEKNIPTSTLQSNIYYHLGLSYYLQGDLKKAVVAYKSCLNRSANNDMYVATANWLYITLRQLHRTREASALLSTIKPEMELIENKDYHRILLLYKQHPDAEKMKEEFFKGESSLSSASTGYGLGNYFLLKGDKKSAREIFEKITSGSQWASFGFIAAENALKSISTPGKNDF